MSGPWFPDDGDDTWRIAIPDPVIAYRLIELISRRVGDGAAPALSITLEDGFGYGHTELVAVATESLDIMRDTLSSDRADEATLDDFAAAVNNLRIVALAIAVTDTTASGDDGGVMGLVSYLSRLLEEAVGALDRSVVPLGDGRYRLKLRSADREIVERLAGELDDGLETNDADLTRLFPPAYGTDEDRSREYDALARHELIDSRRAALATLREALDHPDVDEDGLATLMRAVNDMRLVLGTRLDVTEDVRPRLSPRDPAFPDWLAYERLTHLLAQIIGALSSTA